MMREQKTEVILAPETPTMVIDSIQSKADGTFVIELNGYPFHATEPETPDVFALVQALIKDGAPCTGYVEPQIPGEDLKQVERAWRYGEIERAKWLRERHRDEQDLGVSTTLTAEQFSELLGYLKALRDWPQSPDFPQAEHRPVAPSWIAEQTP
ncbi:phage tail assembly chaperone [Pseudomonas sp. TNT2022 ID357]|uniref:Phage tail assembly chaperone n=1 Tax=Pseudomonas idahonensis TaxID=2942628 RepID=A0ABT5PZE5_9PSED|nr:phage tail assembly chaperone [Pseudomonas idahonensis]MDD1147110.1 phage tail assembly chaperone [Pseudomonas idahonensis]